MPARINGIGTAYIGKRDLQAQHGVCESCHQPGTLSNYETRLWFTVFFIPVIPLTRQQILNYCPRCTRHRVMPIDKWREVQKDAIGTAIASVDDNPDSPDHAVNCHATMAACGKREEAAQYADAMAGRFANNADVMMYLGGWFERIGQSQRADKCFDQALAADPKHPGAQRAAAIGQLQAGKPREAEKMLTALLPPSPLFEPSVFFMLAEAYQAAGDHASAARLFKLVTEAAPTAAKEKTFRKSVEKSEAALGQHGSILAPIPWYKRKAVWWTGLAAAVLAGLVGVDRYFARNRQLFVVNGLSTPLKVRVDGGEPVDVGPNGKRTLAAAEGPHKISVIEPAVLAREDEFAIGGNLIGRWGGGQVHVLDPTRSAVVVWEESVYAANPRDQSSAFRIHAGQPLSTFDRIDYKFEEFPHTIRVEGRSKKVTKHRVALMKLAPMELILSQPDALTGEARLDYLESHAATADSRAVLLQYYWAAAAEQNQLARCREFLKKSLDDRPVDVEWHRMYQAAAEWSGESQSLSPEYDAMLAKDPDNVDLLYLRGRIEPYGADAAKYYDAALAKAPAHGFTWSSKAYVLCGAGEFRAALEAIDKAIAFDSKKGEWKSTRRQILQALGRHDQVVKELQAVEAAGDGPDWLKYPSLIDALAVQGKLDDAEATYAKFAETIDREWPQDPMQLKLKSHLNLLLMSKKYDDVVAEVGQLTDALLRSSWNFGAQLNGGRLDEALGGVESSPAMIAGWESLCLAIAWRNAHNDERAQASLKQAIALFSEGSSEQQIIAGWLREPPPDLGPLVAQLTDLALEPGDKAIVLLALAGTGRAGSEQLLELAGRLSAWPTGRKPFVEATLATMR